MSHTIFSVLHSEYTVIHSNHKNDATISYCAVSSKDGVEVTVEGSPLPLGHFSLQGRVLLFQSPGGVQGLKEAKEASREASGTRPAWLQCYMILSWTDVVKLFTPQSHKQPFC